MGTTADCHPRRPPVFGRRHGHAPGRRPAGGHRLPDVWGGENPQAVQAIHRAYLGGLPPHHHQHLRHHRPREPCGYTVAQVMSAAVANVRAAMDQAGVTDAYVCADIGPTGKLLRPYGLGL